MDLVTWRKDAGLTQRECAERLGVDIRTWQRWEYGERKAPPYIDALLRVIEK